MPVSHFNVNFRSQKSKLFFSFLFLPLLFPLPSVSHSCNSDLKLQTTSKRPKHGRFGSLSLSFCAPTQISAALTRYWPPRSARFAAAKPAFSECAARWRCDAAVHFWPLRAAIALGAAAIDNSGVIYTI